MPFLNFEAVRELVPIERALHLWGWRPTTTWGGTIRGQCPLGHPTVRCPPFEVHPGRKTWHCWRCGRRGDVVQLWALLQRMNVYDAALDLCGAAGVEPPRKP